MIILIIVKKDESKDAGVPFVRVIMFIDIFQFGKRMMKLVKKRNEFVVDIERQRRKRREVIDVFILNTRNINTATISNQFLQE